MPRKIPSRTSACRTVSRCRGGRPWRDARLLAAIGRSCPCKATSTTAAIARSALRGSTDIVERATSLTPNGSPACPRSNPLTTRVGTRVGTKSGTKSRRAETPGPALCRRQSGDFDDLDLRDRGDNKLRHPHAATHNKYLRSVIDENDLDLPAIIRIDGPRGVQDGDAIA